MKVLWCWRCQVDIPMLDEEEFALALTLYREGKIATSNLMDSYHNGDRSIDQNVEDAMNECFRPVCDAYERMTGRVEFNANAVMHHRISLYGPPCDRCGKPLRTPRASFCAACGLERSLGEEV